MAGNKRDYYEILGLKKGESAGNIKKAYRKLARKYHPDFNENDKDAEARFKEVSEAYAVLSNPEAKQKYDQFGHSGGPGFSGFDFSGFDFNRGKGSFSGGGQTYSDFDFGDIFSELFGRKSSGRQGGFSGFQNSRSKGQDVRYTMEVGFAEAAQGTTTSLSLNMGGQVRNINARIPEGVDDGQTIRLKGKGGPGRNGGPAGDLLIEIRIRAHPIFTRKGLDLYCSKKITLGQATLGGKIEVPTLDDKTVTITSPPGTQGGQRFRVKGKGIKKGATQGDIFCDIQIAVPKDLDEESIKLMEQFEDLTRSKYQF